VLAKKYRLTLDKDFRFVYRQKRTAVAPLFIIKYADNHLALSRVAVVISKHPMPRAVDRNASRRRITAILIKLWPRLRLSMDMVYLPKKQILQAKTAEIEKQLTKLFQNKHWL